MEMESLLNPRAVALIGATDEEGSVGRSLLENLLRGRAEREVYAVNPNRGDALGIHCYSSLGELPEPVQLAVIATPAATVPATVAACGEVGVRAVIVISAGFGEIGERGRALEAAVRAVRGRYGMRILGPNCAGVIRPQTNLHATFLRRQPEPGRIAFISQSGAVGSAILDWAMGAGVGFSLFASLGAMLDVDFGDVIDLLADDRETRSALLYMESVGNARKFMSAARAFAQVKPIIVTKPGGHSESVRAMASHTGAQVGRFEVYDAAFKRVGVVRVDEISELFDCARVLDSRHLPAGPRLAVITNAGGPGVIAADVISRRGGQLAELSLATRRELDAALPSYWSRGNPIDLLADAHIERYATAIGACLGDGGIDGMIVIHAPQVRSTPTDLADAVIEVARKKVKPILTVWMGDDDVRQARERFAHADVPTFGTPEEAVAAYLHMYGYKHNLDLLYATPAELPIHAAPPRNHLRIILRRARAEGRLTLTAEECGWFLATYDIASARNSEASAADMGTGIALASFRDVDFGAAILLGHGGPAASLCREKTIGLPPLNQTAARRMIEDSGLARILADGGAEAGESAMRELETLLARFSNLVSDFPEIATFEIGRIARSDDSFVALSATADLEPRDPVAGDPHPHLVITPYPYRYVTPWQLDDGTTVLLRPIRPEDERLEEALIRGFSDRTSRYRFFHVPRDVDHATLVRFCNIDYGRELALIAEHTVDGHRHNVGVGRVSIRPGGEEAEFAVVVADAYQGKGLGTKLLDMLVGFCLEKGLRRVYGVILPDNETMVAVAERLGFSIVRGESEVRAELDLLG